MAPKRRVKGQVVELNRRTAHRAFFLRPGRDTRELLGYMYGKASNDKVQRPCVGCALSGHYHLVQVDLLGWRSEFMQQFNSNVARKRNLQLNRRENLWSASAPGDMVALDLAEVIDRVVYTCLQPVAANLVERVEEWTGFKILPRDWGTKMRFKRPEECGKDMPEFVEFTPMPPPGFEDKPLGKVIAFFEKLIRREENSYARARARAVAGVEACENMNPYATPSTPAPMRTLNPRFACKDKQRVREALRCEYKFRQEYRAALSELQAGHRDVLFPAGTLQMVKIAGVNCAPTRVDDPHATRLEWTTRIQEMWDEAFAPEAA